jgi:dipeptidyl aminopeptidase/acylaminoacyl peptidase
MLSLVFGLIAHAAFAPAGATTDSLTAKELLDVRSAQLQALSPDGRWAAVTLSARRDQLGFVAARDGDPTYVRATPSEFVLIDTRSGAQRPVLATRATVRGAAFSADGARLAFTVFEGNDRWSLRVWEVATGKSTTPKLPADLLVDGTAPLVWAGDGAALWFAGRTARWMADAQSRFSLLVQGPITALGSPKDEPFLPWERLRRESQRRVVLSWTLATGRVAQVVPEGMTAAFTPALAGGTLSWTDDITRKTDYDVIMGREDRLLTRVGDSGEPTVLMPSLKDVTWRWAEDGVRYFYAKDGAIWYGRVPGAGQKPDSLRRRIAAPDSVPASDTTDAARRRRSRTRLTLLRAAEAGDAVLAQTAEAIWLIDTTGARTRVAALPDSTQPDAPRPAVLEWSRDGRYVYLAVNARDRWERALTRWDRQSGETRELVRDGRLRNGLQLSRDGRTLVWSQAESNRVADLWAANADMSEPRRLVETNAWMAGRTAKTELFRYLDADGKPQWGVLFQPLAAPAGPAPTVFLPYEDFFDDSFDATANFLASRGYAVVKPSVSFETGFPGDAWVKGVTAAANALISRGVADSSRLGVQGTSYGGYATNLLITQTKRFKAAINVSGKVDVLSFYTDSPRLGNRNTHAAERSQDRLGATLWQQPQKYWEHSAVLYADRIETPLLLLTGGEDHNVPAINTREMYYALRRLNKTVEWVNYVNGGHGIPMTTEAEFTDWHQRMSGWYGRYLRTVPQK